MLVHLIFAVLTTPAASATPASICELTRPAGTHTTTRRCLGCHDGSIGNHADVGLSSTLGGSHPVDLDYETARLSKASTLVPAALLPAAIALDEGKVTCTSCHDGASQEPKRTSLSMDRSALCQACHAR